MVESVLDDCGWVAAVAVDELIIVSELSGGKATRALTNRGQKGDDLPEYF